VAAAPDRRARPLRGHTRGDVSAGVGSGGEGRRARLRYARATAPDQPVPTGCVPRAAAGTARRVRPTCGGRPDTVRTGPAYLTLSLLLGMPRLVPAAQTISDESAFLARARAASEQYKDQLVAIADGHRSEERRV